MTIKQEICFAARLGKPKAPPRSAKRAAVFNRIPPSIEWVQQYLGYDSDFDRLYFKGRTEAEDLYLEHGQETVRMPDGQMYAVWRLKSAVLLGTFDGYPYNADRLIAKYGTKREKLISPTKGRRRRTIKLTPEQKEQRNELLREIQADKKRMFRAHLRDDADTNPSCDLAPSDRALQVLRRRKFQHRFNQSS